MTREIICERDVFSDDIRPCTHESTQAARKHSRPVAELAREASEPQTTDTYSGTDVATRFDAVREGCPPVTCTARDERSSSVTNRSSRYYCTSCSESTGVASSGFATLTELSALDDILGHPPQGFQSQGFRRSRAAVNLAAWKERRAMILGGYGLAEPQRKLKRMRFTLDGGFSWTERSFEGDRACELFGECVDLQRYICYLYGTVAGEIDPKTLDGFGVNEYAIELRLRNKDSGTLIFAVTSEDDRSNAQVLINLNQPMKQLHAKFPDSVLMHRPTNTVINSHTLARVYADLDGACLHVAPIRDRLC